MSPTPHMKPLSRRQRQIIFILSLLLFCVTVPLLVFYAIGYRIDFSDNLQNIRAVGGIYVSAQTDDTVIYIDDEPVENMRLFQNAAYIQNLVARKHQVHVQGDNLQTWVKQLPVYAHLVTEVASFNLPASSTVRYVAPYVSAGNPLYTQAMQTERVFGQATTSQTVVFATSSPARLGEDNPEYEFITAVFASTTADRAVLAKKEAYQPSQFSFTPPPVFATTTASSTRVNGEVALRMEGQELYALWRGDPADEMPYYFCTFSGRYGEMVEDYGVHVADQIYVPTVSTSTIAATTVVEGNKLCRTKIRIDRKWQSVIWFEFLPNNPSLVLLQLQDGIYVVEIDDRSWQNVQQFYAGDYLTMVVQGGQIFVQDGDIIFELLTDPIIN